MEKSIVFYLFSSSIKSKIKITNRTFILKEGIGKIDENNLDISYKNIEKSIKNTFNANNLDYKLRKNYTQIFLVLDTDVYKNKEQIINFFLKKRIKIIFTSPCFEKILLYHFIDKCLNNKECKFYKKELEKHVKNYIKGNRKQIDEKITKSDRNIKNAVKMMKKCDNNEEFAKFLKFWLKNII